MNAILMKSIANFALISLVVVCLSCDRRDAENDQEENKNSKPVVFVANYTLQYFVQRIAGDFVEIHFPVPDEIAPIDWKPNSQDIASLQKADLIFLNGTHDSPWTQTVALPESKVLDTTRGFREKLIEIKTFKHKHGPEGDLSGKTYASVSWLDFQFAKQQAEVTYQSLKKLLPEKKEELESKWEVLSQDLEKLDQEATAATEQIRGQTILTTQPYYHYFASRYQFKTIATGFELGESIFEQQKESLKKIQADNQANIVIVDKTPDAKVVTQLNDLGLKCWVMPPCFHQPDSDWATSMQNAIDQLLKLE